MEEDYELLKKFFINKEKENIKLKEELESIRNRTESSPNIKSRNNFANAESGSLLNLTTNCQEHKVNSSEENLEFRMSNYKQGLSPTLPTGYISNLKSSIFKKAKDKEIEATKRSKSEIFIRNELNQENELALNTSGYNSPNQINFLTQIPTTSRSKVETRFYHTDMNKVYLEKSKSSNNLIDVNKGVIRNIENSICEIKKHLNRYEKAYDNINTKLELSSNIKLNDADLNIKDLLEKIKQKDEEISNIKKSYENEIELKSEIYNQNISQLNKTNHEEIKKLRIKYENKLDELVKKEEEEKLELQRKISNLEKEHFLKFSRIEISDRNDMIEFQKRYLIEMKELQKTFEDFKIQTYEEFSNLKKREEDAIQKANFYKENFDRLKESAEQTENLYRNNYIALKSKFDDMKNILKNNEILKNQLDISKSEITFLKMKVAKLEEYLNGEEALNEIRSPLMNLDMDYLTEGKDLNESSKSRSNMLNKSSSHSIISNNYTNFNNIQNRINILKDKSSDIVNYDNFSNFFSPNGYKKLEHFTGKSQTNNFNNLNNILQKNYEKYQQGLENIYGMHNTTNELNNPHKIYNMDTLDENLYKVIDLKKAHFKIKEMEDCLKSMNDENENLKEKLELAISGEKNKTNEFNSSHEQKGKECKQLNIQMNRTDTNQKEIEKDFNKKGIDMNDLSKNKQQNSINCKSNDNIYYPLRVKKQLNENIQTNNQETLVLENNLFNEEQIYDNKNNFIYDQENFSNSEKLNFDFNNQNSQGIGMIPNEANIEKSDSKRENNLSNDLKCSPPNNKEINRGISFSNINEKLKSYNFSLDPKQSAQSLNSAKFYNLNENKQTSKDTQKLNTNNTNNMPQFAKYNNESYRSRETKHSSSQKIPIPQAKTVKKFVLNNPENLTNINLNNNNSQEFNFESQENSEDNIIEFPLQLKIKGRLKKVTTHTNKK